jgi:Tol biopolymer transport system component
MNAGFDCLRTLYKPLLLSALLVSAAARICWSQPAKAVDDGDWWLEISTMDKKFRMRTDGSEWTEVAHDAHHGILSPDGRRVVYADSPDLYSEIFVADTNGTNKVQLTNNDVEDGSPSWTKDGKHIVFESGHYSRSQIYVMNADGTNVRQLTHEPIAAQMPKVAPDGRLTYVSLREERDKGPSMDLIVRDSAASRPIVKKPQWYSDYAWSPDGKMISYGKLGGLEFHTLTTGEEREIQFQRDVNRDIYHHGAFNLAWRPDGQAIACSI